MSKWVRKRGMKKKENENIKKGRISKQLYNK